MNLSHQLVSGETASIGYTFLNVDDPLCAWAVAIGALFPPEPGTGELSPRAASVLRTASSGQASLEFALEEVRQLRHPLAASRLGGLFYFPDKLSAERAMSLWGLSHFRPENFSEIGLDPARPSPRFDSNWITFDELKTQVDWMDRYWLGEPAPGRDPIWECVTDVPAVIWNGELRQRAKERALKEFPDSGAFLEFGRAAAAAGYTFCTVKAHWRDIGDEVDVRYYIDMRAAEDTGAVAAIRSRVVDADAINRNAEKGFDTLPDFTRRAFVLKR